MVNRDDETSGINARRKLFACEYIKNGFNVRKAYQKVFPDCSKASLDTKPYQYIKHPDTKRFVKEALDDLYDSKFLDAKRVNMFLVHQMDNTKLDTKTRMTAAQQLSKNLGIEQQNIKTESKNDININISVDDDE